jgi:hypothetical protein
MSIDNEQDQRRITSQLVLFQESNTLRWQMLPIICTLVAGIVAILGQNGFINPSWLEKLVLILSLVSIPVILFEYERQIRLREVASIGIIREILKQKDPETDKKIENLSGGWESRIPQLSVYLIAFIVILIIFGLLSKPIANEDNGSHTPSLPVHCHQRDKKL